MNTKDIQKRIADQRKAMDDAANAALADFVAVFQARESAREEVKTLTQQVIDLLPLVQMSKTPAEIAEAVGVKPSMIANYAQQGREQRGEVKRRKAKTNSE